MVYVGRLAAVLIAFLSGFSGLSAADERLPEAAQRLLDQGRAAIKRAEANKEEWPVAVNLLNEARLAAPLAATPLYYLGLAETQIPGRELRAICWLEAFLALAPQSAQANNVRRVVSDELEVRARSNLDRTQRLLRQLADKMDFEGYRDVEESYLDRLEAREHDLPSPSTQSLAQSSEVYARWQAQRWTQLADRRLNVPAFLDFERALNNASVGHPLGGHYQYQRKRYAEALLGESTPAQSRLDEIFFFVWDLAADIVEGFGDVLNTRAILRRVDRSLSSSRIKTILGPWPCAARFAEGLAAVSDAVEIEGESAHVVSYPKLSGCSDRWGFIDRSGTFVIQPSLRTDGTLRTGASSSLGHLEYDWPVFSEGIAGLGHRFINKAGRVTLRGDWCDAFDFHEGLAKVANCSAGRKPPLLFGFVDKSGKLAIPFVWEDATNFSEGMARVERGGKWGFIDKSGRLIIPLEWEAPRGATWLGSFSEGFAVVQRNGHWGFIQNRNITQQIERGVSTPPRPTLLDWDFAHPFHDGLAVVERGEKRGYIDKSGEVVVPVIWDDAKDFSEGLAKVKQGDTWNFIDKRGQRVASEQLPLEASRIIDHTEHVFRIRMEETLGGYTYDGYGYVEIAW